MEDVLVIWLYGQRVALVDQERGRPRLVYTDEALDRYPLGTPLLSLSLPVSARRYPQGVVRPFFDGLLPEGESRRSIARDVHISEGDTYGLIRALGKDCAGAVVIQPKDDPPPPHPTTTTAEALSETEIGALVRNLRGAPLGVGGRVRISLAGVQEKLVLTRMPDGSWGRPVDGTPTTHILKPEIATYPNTVENETFCMRMAKHLGLDVATVETTEIGGRKLIVVTRYDRTVGANGSVERIHQEDFCQATGLSPETKYEEDGGPSLQRIAGILASFAAPESLERLLEAVTVNAMIGNGDAHAKNFSLMHNKSGMLALAPLYDLMCTLYYGDDRLAMYIDNVHRTNQVTVERITDETAQWGMSPKRAKAIVRDLLGRATSAIAAARDETEGVPDEMISTIEGQLARLRASQ
ncbi:MAG TPA: HipA domain-containing protein [Acidimicrobiales bacterium]|nr:HipA domain-containing protein [Acidimicrobiales bacterium]